MNETAREGHFGTVPMTPEETEQMKLEHLEEIKRIKAHDCPECRIDHARMYWMQYAAHCVTYQEFCAA